MKFTIIRKAKSKYTKLYTTNSIRLVPDQYTINTGDGVRVINRNSSKVIQVLVASQNPKDKVPLLVLPKKLAYEYQHISAEKEVKKLLNLQKIPKKGDRYYNDFLMGVKIFKKAEKRHSFKLYSRERLKLAFSIKESYTDILEDKLKPYCKTRDSNDLIEFLSDFENQILSNIKTLEYQVEVNTVDHEEKYIFNSFKEGKEYWRRKPIIKKNKIKVRFLDEC